MNGKFKHFLDNEHGGDIFHFSTDEHVHDGVVGHQRELGAIGVGRAGELLVMSDLLRQGCGVASVDGDIHTFDLVAIVQENTLYKVQVKTVSEARGSGPYPGAYQWSLRKQQRPRVRYEPDDVDVFALVGLQHGAIAYKRMDDLVKQSGVITSVNLTVERMAGYSRFPYLDLDEAEQETD